MEDLCQERNRLAGAFYMIEGAEKGDEDGIWLFSEGYP
jgi:hypothetical protein